MKLSNSKCEYSHLEGNMFYVRLVCSGQGAEWCECEIVEHGKNK